MLDIDTLCEQLRGLIKATRDSTLNQAAIDHTLEALIGSIRLVEYTRGFKDGFGPYPIAEDCIRERFSESKEGDL
jgi:hypothetical protein